MFGKKKKSNRERYDLAKEEANRSWNRYRNLGSSKRQGVYDRAQMDAEKDRRNVERLYNKDHKEALKLNSKYDKRNRSLPRPAFSPSENTETLPRPAQDSHNESRETLPKPSGLEGKTMVFAISIIGGLALSATSLTATGNVVANFSQTSKGLAGIFLFVFGLAGLVFNLRKK